MMDRKAILAGGALLVLALVTVGAFLMVSRRSDEASTRIALGQNATAPAPAASVEDVAREPIALDHSELIPITVYQDPLCGCCGNWVEHIRSHGFEPQVEYRNDIQEVKRNFGVRPELSSCHTAVVNGYVVEGHVPGDVMRRFLAEAPAARGLTVPGMPMGSPGMEAPDGRVAEYQVLLFTGSGEASVYSTHGPTPPGA